MPPVSAESNREKWTERRRRNEGTLKNNYVNRSLADIERDSEEGEAGQA